MEEEEDDSRVYNINTEWEWDSDDEQLTRDLHRGTIRLQTLNLEVDSSHVARDE